MSATDHSPSDIFCVWPDNVNSGMATAIDLACLSQPRMRAALHHIVSTDTNDANRSPRRLFALAVLGAITGRPDDALPVCVASNLWWAGAEALDDLVDGGARPAADGPGTELGSAGLLTASIACMTVVPQAYLAATPVPERLRLDWLAETSTSSLAAAEGQLADMAREPSALTWTHVMRAYVGKTGAAYERDAVMAARLGTDDETALRGWRAFGQLFGVLRQVHNDNTDGDPATDEDLANGTPTLLLAHALEVLPPSGRGEILTLRGTARSDAAARTTLRAVLRSPEIQVGYQSRLRALRHQARTLLDGLIGPSNFRQTLAGWIDASYVLALPGATEGTPSRG